MNNMYIVLNPLSYCLVSSTVVRYKQYIGSIHRLLTNIVWFKIDNSKILMHSYPNNNFKLLILSAVWRLTTGK